MERAAPHVGLGDLQFSDDDRVDNDKDDQREDEEDSRVEHVQVEDVVAGRGTHRRQVLVRYRLVAVPREDHVVLEDSWDVEQHGQHVDDNHLANIIIIILLGHRISALSGDCREITYLFQRVSVVVQRFNSVLLRESFVADSRPEDDL